MSAGKPSAASITAALVLVIPRIHTEGGWSCKYDRYVRTRSIILGSRSRAFKKRWSPAADCSVSRTIGGRIGSNCCCCVVVASQLELVAIAVAVRAVMMMHFGVFLLARCR